ncbi:hypothetical protein [Frigoribacterium sp. CFBP9030]|uniref:hypothetical protein n=1 Tax=Frigoribacterium sp. CFBP9030 TaxID=3096537 RepID=UPI002A6B003A|nr:hypothetical protein [Frigoribacterium sp. CFBP9030]MDY0891467.1 hypothetical protein [Frigoribacterium sp. CFBP9030]
MTRLPPRLVPDGPDADAAPAAQGVMVRAYGETISLLDHIAGLELDGIVGLESLFAEAIDRRESLMLPGFGAPGLPPTEVARLDDEIRRRIDLLVARGRHDGTVDKTLRGVEVVVCLSLLVQGLPEYDDYDAAAQALALRFVESIAIGARSRLSAF